VPLSEREKYKMEAINNTPARSSLEQETRSSMSLEEKKLSSIIQETATEESDPTPIEPNTDAPADAQLPSQTAKRVSWPSPVATDSMVTIRLSTVGPLDDAGEESSLLHSPVETNRISRVAVSEEAELPRSARPRGSSTDSSGSAESNPVDWTQLDKNEEQEQRDDCTDEVNK